MRKIFYAIFFVLCFLLARHSLSEGGFFIRPSFAANYPSSTGFVNDFAGLYSSEFKSQMESDLTAFEKQTGNEISVVTVKSLEGMDIESYAVSLFEKWKIGKKGKDNGLLLLIAKDDRKIKIEVGYGLEPYITDGRAGEIIRNQMTSEFKNENYEGGTFNAVNQIKLYISSQDVAPKTTSNASNNSEDSFWLVVAGLFILYSFITYAASYLGRTKEIWPGALIGALFGGIGGLLLKSILIVISGVVFMGFIGLFFDWILSRNYQVRKRRGLPTDFIHTWGGFGGGG
ncbi:TPM domain-containing protein, partial [Candidatus Gottesmanbacteria bacterium]|nr:TPM domain-containing protein [Candidatus Gottesmanbacteria bacterium]